MAGDWIKMRVDLATDPSVIGIAAALDCSENEVVGMLHRFWSWANSQSRDGHADGVTKKWIDRYVQRDGFADLLEKNSWLIVHPTGIEIPLFDRHNGASAKTRALAKDRQQVKRGKTSLSERDNSVTREEKRREEKRKDKEPPLPPEGDAAGAASDRPRPKPRKSTTVTATTMTNSVAGLSQDVAEAYLVHRKAKRAPLTDLAWKGIAKTLLDAAQLGAAPDRVLSKAIERGWTGLELEWLINSGVLSAGHQGSPPHLNLDQIDHEEGLERQADGTYRIARP
ncbi:TPA: hypothetical protein ACPWE9_003367 [Pseudomonas aeruginosa]|nr:hypothetical protein [Pseudomonas aeruginosa]MBI8274931.1 hypothetical protein [Pseudomonas aeruginosa]MCS7645600.1 hypothetical protein [Pseudomonas aeruginosa]